jgi:hypothetical protein
MIEYVLLAVIILLVWWLYYCSQQTATYRQVRESIKLWGEHVYYTREFLVRKIYKLPHLDEITQRLLRNQQDLAKLINKKFPGTYDDIKQLLTKHILIAAKLVDQLMANVDSVATLQDWYANGRQIADKLSTLGIPSADTIMAAHLKSTVDEVTKILAGESGIAEHDVAQKHMFDFAQSF